MATRRDIPHAAPAEVRCTRCGTTWPKDPRAAAWMASDDEPGDPAESRGA